LHETPFSVEPNKSKPTRAAVDRYIAVVRKLADTRGAVYVDAQKAFDEGLAHTHPFGLAGDHVHPNLTGHMIITRAFLNAIDFDRFWFALQYSPTNGRPPAPKARW